MLEPDSGLRVLAFAEPVLTSGAVQQMAEALRDERSARPVVLDCARLSEVTPAGLSALLELGRSSGGLRELVLCALTRPLTLAAIQAGLGERFAIYANEQACQRDLHAASRAAGRAAGPRGREP